MRMGNDYRKQDKQDRVFFKRPFHFNLTVAQQVIAILRLSMYAVQDVLSRFSLVKNDVTGYWRLRRTFPKNMLLL